MRLFSRYFPYILVNDHPFRYDFNNTTASGSISNDQNDQVHNRVSLVIIESTNAWEFDNPQES